MGAKWWFSNLSISSMLISCILLQEWSSPYSTFIHFFIDLFLSSQTHEFIFILWVVSLYWCYSFWSSHYSRFGQWEPLLAGFCVPLIQGALFIFKLSNISLVLLYPGPSPRISHFFKSLWFLLEDTDIQKSNFALRVFVHQKPSKWSQRIQAGNIYKRNTACRK